MQQVCGWTHHGAQSACTHLWGAETKMGKLREDLPQRPTLSDTP